MIQYTGPWSPPVYQADLSVFLLFIWTDMGIHVSVCNRAHEKDTNTRYVENWRSNLNLDKQGKYKGGKMSSCEASIHKRLMIKNKKIQFQTDLQQQPG